MTRDLCQLVWHTEHQLDPGMRQTRPGARNDASRVTDADVSVPTGNGWNDSGHGERKTRPERESKDFGCQKFDDRVDVQNMGGHTLRA